MLLTNPCVVPCPIRVLPNIYSIDSLEMRLEFPQRALSLHILGSVRLSEQTTAYKRSLKISDRNKLIATGAETESEVEAELKVEKQAGSAEKSGRMEEI